MKKETMLKQKKPFKSLNRSSNLFFIMRHWILVYLDGDKLRSGALTGPLRWLCTVKSGQKSRSAMASSSDSANGRAPSSSSSSSAWKGKSYCKHLNRSGRALLITYCSRKWGKKDSECEHRGCVCVCVKSPTALQFLLCKETKTHLLWSWNEETEFTSRRPSYRNESDKPYVPDSSIVYSY